MVANGGWDWLQKTTRNIHFSLGFFLLPMGFCIVLSVFKAAAAFDFVASWLQPSWKPPPPPKDSKQKFLKSQRPFSKTAEKIPKNIQKF